MQVQVQVLVSDSKSAAPNDPSPSNSVWVSIHRDENYQGKNIEPNIDRVGRHVAIYMYGSGSSDNRSLTLSEVEIYGFIIKGEYKQTTFGPGRRKWPRW